MFIIEKFIFFGLHLPIFISIETRVYLVSVVLIEMIGINVRESIRFTSKIKL